MDITLKPIFHQNAKYLASGVGVGQCPRRQNFALEIPTCWYILALPNAKFCVTPDPKPQRQPVEYSLRWVIGVGSRVGHVHFIFFVFISFALDNVFLVEYGLNCSENVWISNDSVKCVAWNPSLYSHYYTELLSCIFDCTWLYYYCIFYGKELIVIVYCIM